MTSIGTDKTVKFDFQCIINGNGIWTGKAINHNFKVSIIVLWFSRAGVLKQ
ncbi:MAG: hypothetical protein MUE64_09375 [Ignavibacteriaceae bacterium]|nr:hypothetical protein [Ignavibacteriaceae bacterium]